MSRLVAIVVAVALVSVAVIGCAVAPRASDAGARRPTSRDWILVNGRGGPSALVDAPVCERACALVIVDGFNNTIADATRNFDGIAASYRDAGGACDVFGFTWDGDVGLTRFARAEAAADGNASRALTAWLRRERELCSRAVHLVGHSLAARVILRALTPSPAGERLTVESAALIAPAIAADALERDGELGAAVPQIGRLGVFYNSEDYMVLGLFYPLASRRRTQPLGLAGSKNRARVPPNVVELDFADRWGPTHAALRAYDRAFWETHLRTLGIPRDSDTVGARVWADVCHR
jgi:hypothetical protein